jgi:hypothetical protein
MKIYTKLIFTLSIVAASATIFGKTAIVTNQINNNSKYTIENVQVNYVNSSGQQSVINFPNTKPGYTYPIPSPESGLVTNVSFTFIDDNNKQEYYSCSTKDSLTNPIYTGFDVVIGSGIGDIKYLNDSVSVKYASSSEIQILACTRDKDTTTSENKQKQ